MCIFNHKWEVIDVQHLRGGIFTWTENNPVTIVTYRCSKCGNVKQDEFDGWIKKESLLKEVK